MQAQRLDHLVLTVASIDRTTDFYTRVLGMERIEFGDGRVALAFGEQKINLHEVGNEFKPNARRALPGSADLCFVIDVPVARALAQLEAFDVDVIEGPVRRTGARGAILSAYFRDPDGNLVEVSNYVDDATGGQ